MLPFWLFNPEGRYKPGTDNAATQKTATALRKRTRNQLPADRARLRSYLSQCTVPGDVSDAVGSDTQDVSAVVDAESQENSQRSTQGEEVRYWRKQEVEQRNKLPNWWLRVVNRACHRKEILADLRGRQA
jgi:hypothetical protein